jgi:hypothetical protein
MSAYTDDDVQAAEDAVEALYDDGEPHEHEEELRAALAAVAPAIAARALREGQAYHEREADKADSQTARTVHLVIADAYRTRADEIERTP